jgi:hypothetical protein
MNTDEKGSNTLNRMSPDQLAVDLSNWAIRYGLYEKQTKNLHAIVSTNVNQMDDELLEIVRMAKEIVGGSSLARNASTETI